MVDEGAGFLGLCRFCSGRGRQPGWLRREGFPRTAAATQALYLGDEFVPSCALDVGKGAHALGRECIRWGAIKPRIPG